MRNPQLEIRIRAGKRGLYVLLALGLCSMAMFAPPEFMAELKNILAMLEGVP